MKQASRDLALCGVLCALAVAIMAMGTILPVATYCAPVLASMTLLPVLVLCGEKLSWAMFFASAMLSLLLAPDKEAHFMLFEVYSSFVFYLHEVILCPLTAKNTR